MHTDILKFRLVFHSQPWAVTGPAPCDDLLQQPLALCTRCFSTTRPATADILREVTLKVSRMTDLPHRNPHAVLYRPRDLGNGGEAHNRKRPELFKLPDDFVASKSGQTLIILPNIPWKALE